MLIRRSRHWWLSTCRLSDLDTFSSIGDAETARLYRNYLLDSLAAGETSPDRWFAAVDGDDVVGRIVIWGLPGGEVSLDVFALRWPNNSCAAFALDFLRTAVEWLRAAGIRAVEYEHEPTPRDTRPVASSRRLASAGFHKARMTVRFEPSPVVAGPASRRIHFEGEADGVPEDDFVRVVARCAPVGDDRGMTRRHADKSVERAAAEFVAATRLMRGGSELWRIGRIDGEVVGVILPTANDGGLVLNYVGVVPGIEASDSLTTSLVRPRVYTRWPERGAYERQRRRQLRDARRLHVPDGVSSGAARHTGLSSDG